MKQLIKVLCFVCLVACKTNGKSQSAYQGNVETVKKLLDSTDLGKNYNGSILIADGKDVLFKKSYGTNPQNNQPNEVDTKYGIASMGKMFTAISIMQLLEKEQLTLQQTIGDIFPDYPNEQAKKITIQQLLSHTSGLGDFFGPEFDKNSDNIKSLQDHLPYFVNDPLEFTPGEQMRYSNAGFIILGLIIEKITGVDHNSYVTKNILIPSGTSSATSLSSSAGGGDLTVEDLHKFAVALKSNELISEESHSQITTDHFGNGYGYGMSLRNLNGKEIYGHNGGAPGASGELDLVKGESLIIATLSNRSPMDGWAQVRTHLRKEFFGSTPKTTEFLNTEEVVKTYKEQGFEKASKLLAKLDNNISDRNTFRFAQQYAEQGQVNKAVDILKLIVQAYPDQWHPYSFLADFQLQAGLKDEAIKNYKKSLEINPENQQAIEQLKKIE
ncbi:serine hydrolase domain-containing protein [Spongiivirga citrea]|uniref:Serine hydrolase n=1 Tax=Spongiivirga citrea TaxID=1481457 RepID=A0A6M0CJG7_9FLAO|nr:serine hydrolase domain-containing protein [Spongiivirga citrea]NER16124.1 serine hydrolase [Spongiivirga citrea]